MQKSFKNCFKKEINMRKKTCITKKDSSIEDPHHPGHWISRVVLRKRRNGIKLEGPLAGVMKPTQVVFNKAN